ncbi:ABC transporter permease [Treponema sp. OMZ 840]|uniref:ABC transporter permease n=1 Tax=Treponema sp. OMZ 840 TaxID=244313 RepID=UPI003D92B736
MTLKASFLYALRIILPNYKSVSNGRKSLFGAVFGIALSLVPLIVVLVVADGMIEGITERMIGLSSYHMQVLCPESSLSGFDEQVGELNRIAEKLENLTGGTAFIEKQGMALAAGKKGRTGAAIRSVDGDIFINNEAFKTYIEVLEGQAAFPDAKSAVIGRALAEKLELKVGDTIRLITANLLSASDIRPKMLSCKISGIVSSGYEEIDALWVFVPFKTGFSFLPASSSRLCIGIETDFPFSERLEKAYRSAEDFLPAGYRIKRWSDMNTAQYENYASTKMLLILIMFLILLIASVNISSALIMVVMERKKEIAILKSIGASSSGISTAFLITGIICGMGGVCLGLPLGLVCAVNCNEIIEFSEKAVNLILKIWYRITGQTMYSPVTFLDPAYYLQTIPVHISFREMFFIALQTLGLSALVSVFPAVRAGKEKPLHILRKT